VTTDKKMVLYRTSDIYFSAYLCALDLVLLTTEQEREGDKTKMVFVFSLPIPDIPRLKASYFGGTGQVQARKFVDALRSLKSMTHTVIPMLIGLWLTGF